jgi:LacI family transcriptional regulator
LATGLKDIAKRSRVSFQTVSAVLSPKGGNTRVSNKTRERILQAAKELNYRKNTAGRGLVAGRTFTLGYIVPSLQYPTTSRFAECFQRLAGEINYGVMINSLDNHDEKTVSQMKILSEHCVDGILLNPTMSNKDVSCIEILQQYKIPFVVSADVPEYDVTFASYDNYDEVYQLTDHVLHQGYHRPALLTSWPSRSSTPRLVMGFQTRLQEEGIDPECCMIVHQEKFDDESIRQTLDRILEHPGQVDSLLITDVVVAMQAYLYLQKKGMDVGRRFGLAASDDTTWFSESCLSITCIQFPIPTIAKTLLDMLLRRIENSDAPRETKYIKGRLMARDSTKRL